MSRFLRFLVLWAGLTSSSINATEIWFEDNNLAEAGGLPADFALRYTDQKEGEWAKSRSAMKVFYLRTSALRHQSEVFSEHFVSGNFRKILKFSSVKLAFDTGDAFGLSRRMEEAGQSAEQVLRKSISEIAYFSETDLTPVYITLQSQLSRPLRRVGEIISYTLDERIADAITYIRVVNQHFPQIHFGLIDALPTHGKEYRQPYRLLVERLNSQLGLKLHHIHLDLPEEIATEKRNGMSWQKAVDISTFVRSLDIKFGLALISRDGGNHSSKFFHEKVLKAKSMFQQAGGHADIFFMTSFYRFPDQSIPESGREYTFFRTLCSVAFGEDGEISP